MNRTIVPPPVTLVMEAAEAWLPARMEAVEERLRRLAEGHGEALAADAEATLAAGGKRLRPMLVLLSAGPGAGEVAIRAATAIELVHMATLVHDDVLDAAPLRRGHPTVVARSGRDRRWRWATCCSREPSPSLEGTATGRQVELLSTASVALALGELAQRRDAFDGSISAERYLERCELKTAPPVRVRLPDRTGRRRGCSRGRPRHPLGALRTFGREIGLAFQLLDDVLDVTGPTGAHRQGPRHGPARRHRDPAPDPGSASAIDSLAELNCEDSTPTAAEAHLRPDRGDGRPRRGPGRRPQAGGACQARA